MVCSWTGEKTTDVCLTYQCCSYGTFLEMSMLLNFHYQELHNIDLYLLLFMMMMRTFFLFNFFVKLSLNFSVLLLLYFFCQCTCLWVPAILSFKPFVAEVSEEEGLNATSAFVDIFAKWYRRAMAEDSFHHCQVCCRGFCRIIGSVAWSLFNNKQVFDGLCEG